MTAEWITEDPLVESLNDALDEVDAPPRQNGVWRITDDGQADWAMRKLTKVDAQRQKVRDLVSARVDALLTWQANQLAVMDAEAEHWEILLTNYHADELREDPKRKTIQLPCGGKLEARQQPDIWAYADPDKFCEWAMKGGRHSLVRTTYVPAKDQVKKELDPVDGSSGLARPVVDPVTGEVVEGLTVTAGAVKFTAKPGEAK